MKNSLLNQINTFKIQGTINQVTPFGKGLINDTYLLENSEPEKPDYILQRKNHLIFKDIKGMMENIAGVSRHICEKLKKNDCTNISEKHVCHIPTKDGRWYYKDKDGNYWTLCLFIKGSKTIERAENETQAYVVGKAFGQFQQQLSNYPMETLHTTIKDFHDINFRLQNFQTALYNDTAGRKTELKNEIDFFLQRAEEMKTLYKLEKAGKIPLRVTHNDTKINNILFDKNDKILCVIDLDTVMPGLVHYDFGDAIRTIANNSNEEEKNLNNVFFKMEFYQAFAKGFLSELKGKLNTEEIKHLPHAAKFMTYIMGLRFLTDYIAGDVYYKINYPENNLQRALTQIKLLRDMEKQFSAMQDIVKNS